MRVPFGLVVGTILAANAWAAPLQEADPAVHRGQPVSYFVARLKAKDWPTRLDAARSLRAVGRQAWSAVPALITALDDDDADVRAAVVEALGAIGFASENSLSRLCEIYQHLDHDQREHVLSVMLLIDIRSPYTLKALQCALGDEDPKLRELALWSAIHVPDLDDKELLAAARDSLLQQSAKVRSTAAGVLVYLGDSGRAALLEAAKGTDRGARASAVEMLAHNQGLDEELTRQLVHALAKMLADEDDDDRLLACTLLASLGPQAEGATIAIEKALKDPSAAVRTRAAGILIQIAPPKTVDAVEVLTEVLRDHKYFAKEVTTLLGSAGPAALPAVPMLVKLADDGSHEAVEALGKIGPKSPAVMPALISALTKSSGSQELKNSAAGALQTIGGAAKSHVPALRRLLTDDLDYENRFRIGCALVDMGCTDNDIIEFICNAAPNQESIYRLGALAQDSPVARKRLVEIVHDFGNSQPRWRRRDRMGFNPLGSLALQELLRLDAPLPEEAYELLNSTAIDAQSMAYYLFKKRDPQAIEKADSQLLTGEQQPARDGKTLAQWLAQAHHHDLKMRTEARKKLTEFPYPRIVLPALLDGLDDQDLNLEEQAADTLRRYFDGTDFLLAAAATGDENIRSRLQDPVTSPILNRQLTFGPMAVVLQDDPDPLTCLLAACATNRRVNVQALLSAMHKDRNIRRAAAARLSSTNEIAAAIPILLAMTSDDDVEHRCAAVGAVARQAAFSDSIQLALRATMAMKEPEVRRVTAEALGSYEYDERTSSETWDPRERGVSNPAELPKLRNISRMLVELLSDPVLEVRRTAARSLGHLGPHALVATQALRSALDDPEVTMRIASAESLWRIDTDRQTEVVITALRRALKAGLVEDHRAALLALQQVGPAAGPAFADVAALARLDRGFELGPDPVRTLHAIDPSPKTFGLLLVEFLKDPGRRDLASVAAYAGDFLSLADMKLAVPLLERLLSHKQEDVRAAAVYALGSIGLPAASAIPAMLNRIRESHFEDRTCISMIEGMIEPGESTQIIVAFLLQQAQDPANHAFRRCARWLPLLGSDAETLVPCLLQQIETGQIDREEIWSALRFVTFTERSIPQLQDMLLAGEDCALLACSALATLGPGAEASVDRLRYLADGPNSEIASAAVRALLAIESTPSSQTRKTLLRTSLTPSIHHKHWLTIKSNLIQLGPELNQYLQELVEELRAEDGHEERSRHGVDVLKFVAELGEHAAYILPELFELQRTDDQFCLWGNTGYEEILNGRDHPAHWAHSPTNGSPLWRLVRYDTPWARALQTFLRNQGKVAIPVLSRYLVDGDPKVRLFAAYCAGLLGTNAAEIRKALIAALMDRRGFPENAKRFERLESIYLIEVLHAVVAVGPDAHISKEIAQLLKHKDPMVQATAAWVIEQPGINDEEALTALRQATDDVEPVVAVQVVTARLRHDGKEDKAAQDLMQFLDKRNSYAHYHAAWALCRLGRSARPSMETFAKWAKSADYHERLYAAEAYWAIGGQTQFATSLCFGILDTGENDPAIARLLERMGAEGETARILSR